MSKLIVNADDFGYSKGVNLGIIEAHANGIVTSTTMMMNMPEVQHAVKLASAFPELDVGIHFVLTAGRPMATDVPSLTDSEGNFLKQLELLSHVTKTDIEKEYRAQLAAFLDLGLVPSHFDSHHHMHFDQRVYTVLEKLALEYDVPIRRPLEKYNQAPDPVILHEKVKTTEMFTDLFYQEGEPLTEQILLDILDDNKQYDSVEVMAHPAYIDQLLYSSTSYALPRAAELAILTSPVIKQAIADRGIALVGYRNIS